MNVLFLPSWYPRPEYPLSGIFFKEQARALYNQGVNVYVLCLDSYSMRNIFDFFRLKKKKYIFDDGGIKTYIISYLNIFPKMRLFFYFFSTVLLIKYFHFVEKNNGIRFDLVHIHSALSAGIIYYLSKIPTKFIITEHSTLYSRNLLSFWERRLIPKVFNTADHVIAVGNGLKKDMSRYTDRNIDVIFNLVIMEKYICKQDDTKKKFRFFSLGMSAYKKGFDILISAYSQSSILDETELYIAGLSEAETLGLENLIKKYQLKNVKLFGLLSREAVAYHMYNCDCFALTSRFETFGVVFAEAMFWGKPVIATRTGGPDSFVTPETGILVSVENQEQTTQAMEQMFFNRNHYNQTYISQYAEKNFGGKNIAEKIIFIYEKVLRNDK
jgi:glycosyltransferase involved in cell wall biosynthesis